MSIIHHERAFEDEICRSLAADGWLVSETDREPGFEYDKVRALVPGDVFAWIQETQPEQWAKVVRPDSTPEEQARQRGQLLDRLVKVLDTAPEHGGGALNVLRKGFKKAPAAFRMCEFQPASSLNQGAYDRYRAVRLRVMRQVHYSTKRGNTNSIDLVLFVNGIPVATIELKTDNTQSLDAAISQYRNDRDPRSEPLLGFATRCLVHFAVSNDKVAMTTRLAGKRTHFLPFDRGNEDGAGNAPNPAGAATSYLWEQVLQRDAWLHILGRLLHLEHRSVTDPISGTVQKTTTLLFPRYHQWDLVTRLLAAAREEGPGHQYLVQHSAGSGKTNSIAWLAHGLASLHDEQDDKVFDTVIVITDRTVLDDQLQQAIRQIEGVDGTVATINADAVRKAGDTIKAKSGLLAHELGGERLIVVVTLQTFPYALEAIRNSPGLAHKRFAIIADEAHSSQAGGASKKLRSVLTKEEQAEVEDGGSVDIESQLAAELTGRATSPNVSFFAFTATPKPKTMDLFGRIGPDGTPQPFHVYSMRQAIEEGYILDVLRSYTTYDTAFRIAEKARGRRLTPADDLEEVDEAAATKWLMRWVALHPTNIAQKVQIIVEHFRTNVGHLLDGHAKAMVVTSSREAAVRYKDAIDRYIERQGYELGTLVAFSGTLVAKDVPGVPTPKGHEQFSEANLNEGLRGRTLPVAFASDDFDILIVANKYQTGFDQPLLCAMYVDKRLDGITAVQTLSRLNRTYPARGKDATFILDFVNEPQEILKSFQQYYTTAQVESAADPDVVHDLQAKLDQVAVYTPAEVQAFADAFLAEASHGAHTAPLKSAADRFNTRYARAVEESARSEQDTLDQFRKDAGSFVRLYDFLSQIIDYGDTGLEKLSLFIRLLLPRLTGRVTSEPIDFSAVELTHIKQARAGDHTLDLASGAAVRMRAADAIGSGTTHDPHMVLLAEILQRINQLFADEDFDAPAVQGWSEGIVTVLGSNEHLRMQAAVNTAAQFADSPNLEPAVMDAAVETQDAHSRILDFLLRRKDVRTEVTKALGEMLYENLRIERDTGVDDEPESLAG